MGLARIFFIVENHLSIPYIESRKDLNPGLKIIRSTVKDIVDTSKENISINVIESERSRVNNKFHKKKDAPKINIQRFNKQNIFKKFCKVKYN